MRITYHTAIQENLNLNEKRQLTDINTNITDVGVLWKGFKTNLKNQVGFFIVNISPIVYYSNQIYF